MLVDARWRADVIQSGRFDLSGLLAAVEGVIGQNQANFLVLDAIDALPNMVPDPLDARRALLRLQHWTEDLALTTLVTMKGNGPLKGQSGRGFLEDLAIYMADCVLELERDSFQGIDYRTLYIQKYRGSGHPQNKEPYTIRDQGVEIVPAGASAGGFKVYTERLSTGMADLDEMLVGGIFRGSTTLVTGAPGTTKTTFAAGVAHSNQVRELILNSNGIRLEPVYTEKAEVLMGAMRWQREEEDRQAERRERLESLVARLPQEIEVVQEIIDVTQKPSVALELGIFSTPTLTVSSGKLKLRFVGDLSDARKVVRAIAPGSDRP